MLKSMLALAVAALLSALPAFPQDITTAQPPVTIAKSATPTIANVEPAPAHHSHKKRWIIILGAIAGSGVVTGILLFHSGNSAPNVQHPTAPPIYESHPY